MSHEKGNHNPGTIQPCQWMLYTPTEASNQTIHSTVISWDSHLEEFRHNFTDGSFCTKNHSIKRVHEMPQAVIWFSLHRITAATRHHEQGILAHLTTIWARVVCVGKSWWLLCDRSRKKLWRIKNTHCLLCDKMWLREACSKNHEVYIKQDFLPPHSRGGFTVLHLSACFNSQVHFIYITHSCINTMLACFSENINISSVHSGGYCGAFQIAQPPPVIFINCDSHDILCIYKNRNRQGKQRI